MHPKHEVDRALALVADGMNDSQIARVTGISRTTVREWRRLGPPGGRLSRRRPSLWGVVGSIAHLGCVEIYASWQHWPCLFPQHGPGPKYLRPITLTRWQEAIVARYRRQLLRGLIHSDGCRVMNRVWGGRYEYPRCFFSNNSQDILRIFREACTTMGVHHRNSKPNVVSMARRHDVAILDSFIGPKA